MEWKRLSLGPLQTNAFVVYNQENQALMIDPGGDEDRLIQWLREKKLTITAILLTHAHFDHIGAVEGVRDTFQCPVYVHKREDQWLIDPQLNGSALFSGIKPIKGEKADHHYPNKRSFQVGSFTCKLYETPGHSPGSVSFYFPEEKVIFSGDVLFRGGVGRTDLPGGDEDTLINTIHEKLLSLPNETIVANGHGPETTIGEEKETNPFINGFGW